MRYFIADLHIQHKAAVQWRDWAVSKDHMTDVIVTSINNAVEVQDELFILGDLTFGKYESLVEFFSRLNCKNIKVIKGNHDKRNYLNRLVTEGYIHSWSETTTLRCEVDIFLSHYPHVEWNRSHLGTYHLFGHVHGRLSDDRRSSRSMDVGVDAIGTRPISEEDVHNKLEHEPINKTFSY